MSAPNLSRPEKKALLTPRSSAILARKAGRAVEFLLAHGTLPVLFWLKKDILSVPAERERRNLEKYAERVRLLESQNADGGWRLKKAPSAGASMAGSRLLATVRNGFKLYDYGCDLRDEAVGEAAAFILSHQSRDGAFSETGSQLLSLDGQALCLDLLCRLGLDDDTRVQKGYRRLVKAQRSDGGWSDAEAGAPGPAARRGARRVPRSSPRVTGVVLGALAESSRWKKSPEAHRAGEWMLDRFFLKKTPTEPDDAFRWSDISYPFWTTNILGCVDALSRMGFRPENRRLRLSLEWLLRRQQPAGHWESKPDKASPEDHLWVTLSVLRVLKRFGLVSP